MKKNLLRTLLLSSALLSASLLFAQGAPFTGTADITLTRPRSVRTKRLLAAIARDAGGNVAKAATGDPAPRKTTRSAKR